jgi:hypothetical protein
MVSILHHCLIFGVHFFPIGSPIDVHDLHHPYNHVDPSVTALPNGDFVVAWSSKKVSGIKYPNGPSMFLNRQTFSVAGVKRGFFNLSSNHFSSSSRVSVGPVFDDEVVNHKSETTTLRNGNFVALYSNNDGLSAQIFNDAGDRLGSLFLIAPASWLNVVDSTRMVTNTLCLRESLSNEKFILIWKSNRVALSGGGGGYQTNYSYYAEFFTTNKSGGKFLLNKNPIHHETPVCPKVVNLKNGNFLVIWHNRSLRDYLTGYSGNIIGQILSPEGNKSGAEFQVNGYNNSPGLYTGCAVGASLSDGSVVIVTELAKDINGQLLTAEGGRIGKEFQVNSIRQSDVYHRRPVVVSSDSDDDFMVAWRMNDGRDPYSPDRNTRRVRCTFFSNSPARLSSNQASNLDEGDNEMLAALIGGLAGGSILLVIIACIIYKCLKEKPCDKKNSATSDLTC